MYPAEAPPGDAVVQYGRERLDVPVHFARAESPDLDGVGHAAPARTVRTTLPVFCPVSTYRAASTTSSRRYVRSITGR